MGNSKMCKMPNSGQPNLQVRHLFIFKRDLDGLVGGHLWGTCLASWQAMSMTRSSRIREALKTEKPTNRMISRDLKIVRQ
jgi:hypothetical protein